MTIDFWMNHITYLGKSYHIIIPAFSIDDTYIIRDSGMYFWYSNNHDFLMFTAINVLAHQYKDYIFYIPTRKNPLTDYLKNIFEIEHGLDLFLSHHLIQFNFKHWKVLRSRLKCQQKVSFEVDENQFKDLSWSERNQFLYHENKDYLDVREQYDTLFLVGSSIVFSHLSTYCLQLSKESQDYELFDGFYEHRHLDIFTRPNNKVEVIMHYYENSCKIG